MQRKFLKSKFKKIQKKFKKNSKKAIKLKNDNKDDLKYKYR